jgi:uncharacterized protein
MEVECLPEFDSLNNIRSTFRMLFNATISHEPRKASGRSANVLLSALNQIERETAKKAFAALSSGISRSSPKLLSAVLIKPVGDRCNLACTYCYEETPAGRYAVAGNMSKELLSKLVEDAFENERGGEITFNWHGGEPLLAGREFYKLAIEFQQQSNTRNVKVVNVIQTNGTIVDDEWITFLKEFDFRVGVSVDGPIDLHDIARVNFAGKGTFDPVIAAIRKLRGADIPLSVITVVTESHLGRGCDLYRLLASEGVKHFDVHPAFPGSLGRPALSPASYSSFVIELFEAWLSGDDIGMSIGVVKDALQAFMGGNPSICYHNGSCSQIVAIEPDGNVVPCTRPFNRELFTFGNATKDKLHEIASNSRSQTFREQDITSQDAAKTCRWYSMCHNGCPQHRPWSQKDGFGRSFYCTCSRDSEGGNPEIWRYIAERSVQLLTESITS